MPTVASQPPAPSFQSAIDEGLRYALHHGASVEFSCHEKSFRGRLERLDQQRLTLSLDVGQDDCLHIECNGGCTLTVFCGLGMIAFSSQVQQVCPADGTVVVTIDDAKSLRAPQRRRFWRTPCRDSTRVLLTPNGRASFESALLNISADGLACLVDTAVAPEDARGERWYLSFRLANQFSPVSVSSRLRSISPGSNPGKSILRFQFEFGADSNTTREQIHAAISPVA